MKRSLIDYVPFISALLLFTTSDEYIWGLSLLSLFSSLTFMLCFDIAYNTDCENAGKYLNIMHMYKNLEIFSIATLLFAMCRHIHNSTYSTSYFGYSCIIFCVVLSYYYMIKCVIRDKRVVARIFLLGSFPEIMKLC